MNADDVIRQADGQIAPRARAALQTGRHAYRQALEPLVGTVAFTVGDTVVVDSPHTRGIPGMERQRANFRGYSGDGKAVVVINGVQSEVDAAWLEPAPAEAPPLAAQDAALTALQDRYTAAWGTVRGTWAEVNLRGWPDPARGDAWRLDYGRREMINAVRAAEAQAREVTAYTPAPDRAARAATTNTSPAPALRRCNPAIPAVGGYENPGLTEDHDDADARAIVEAAKQHGTVLGQGGFGRAEAVKVNGVRYVVKFPARKNNHGKTRTAKDAKRWLLHEAGIANRLEGNPAVPFTTFVDGPGWDFALVREYGEPVDPARLTLSQIAQLEADLLAVEASGVQVDDDLLILSRPDGELFIGDVGWWRVLDKPWGTSMVDPESKLGDLLYRALEGAPDTVRKAVAAGRYAHATPGLVDTYTDAVDRALVTGKPGFAALLLRSPANAVLVRDAVGLPVRADVRAVVREAARIAPSWDPDGDARDHKNLGALFRAAGSEGLDLPDPTDPYTVQESP